MQKQPINTAPISQFLSLVKSAEASRQKEIRMDLDKAKKLHYCLTELLARHTEDLEKLLVSSSDTSNEIIDVKMDGGSGW
jgi:F0F1-type ATP synthase membrane subunit b/b'